MRTYLYWNETKIFDVTSSSWTVLLLKKIPFSIFVCCLPFFLERMRLKRLTCEDKSLGFNGKLAEIQRQHIFSCKHPVNIHVYISIDAKACFVLSCEGAKCVSCITVWAIKRNRWRQRSIMKIRRKPWASYIYLNLS